MNKKLPVLIMALACTVDVLIKGSELSVLTADFGITAAIISAITAAAGIAAAGASAGKASKAANEKRKKQGIINEQEAYNEGLFNKEYYQDFSKRAEIQNMLRQANENLKIADARSSAKSAIIGATPEQQLASQESNRRIYSDTVANLASNASMLRDNILRDYKADRNRYYSQRLGMQDELAAIDQNVSNQWATASDNAFKATANVASNIG